MLKELWGIYQDVFKGRVKMEWANAIGDMLNKDREILREVCESIVITIQGLE